MSVPSRHVMTWTAWKNSASHGRGVGYGFKVAPADRARHFNHRMETVVIELPRQGGAMLIEANVAKKSFWTRECGELIQHEIGNWLREEGLVPWPKGSPPRFVVSHAGPARFRVMGLTAA